VTEDVVERAGALLRDLGLAAEVSGHREFRLGGNNRVVRLETDRGFYVAKLYFTDADDRRDRLRAEYGFLQYAVQAGLRCVPRPIAADPAQRLAIYEYVDGVARDGASLSGAEVRQAIDFFAALNAGSRLAAQGLPAASDAGFSIADHLDRVEQRLGRLRRLPAGGAIEREAAVFVGDVATVWESVKLEVGQEAARLRLSVDGPLPPHERCLSPSDFGFHNALVRPSGEVVFLDFEYAGWDDPAKAVGDFFCQPQVPIDREWFALAAARFTAHAGPESRLVSRARLLLPVFWLKWCLLRLNEFTPEALRRRLFAEPGRDVEALKHQRLAHARAALAALPELRASIDASTPPA
jgi:hypothetical protein